MLRSIPPVSIRQGETLSFQGKHICAVDKYPFVIHVQYDLKTLAKLQEMLKRVDGDCMEAVDEPLCGDELLYINHDAYRCKVDSVFFASEMPQTCLITLLDNGERKFASVSQLFLIPPELTKFKRQCVSVALADTRVTDPGIVSNILWAHPKASYQAEITQCCKSSDVLICDIKILHFQQKEEPLSFKEFLTRNNLSVGLTHRPLSHGELEDVSNLDGGSEDNADTESDDSSDVSERQPALVSQDALPEQVVASGDAQEVLEEDQGGARRRTVKDAARVEIPSDSDNSSDSNLLKPASSSLHDVPLAVRLPSDSEEPFQKTSAYSFKAVSTADLVSSELLITAEQAERGHQRIIENNRKQRQLKICENFKRNGVCDRGKICPYVHAEYLDEEVNPRTVKEIKKFPSMAISEFKLYYVMATFVSGAADIYVVPLYTPVDIRKATETVESFDFQDDSDSPKHIEMLQKRLQRTYEDRIANSENLHPGDCVAVCVVESTQNVPAGWYRGKVSVKTGRDSQMGFGVTLVDHGAQVLVSEKQVCLLDDEVLLKWPAQAIKVGLKGTESKSRIAGKHSQNENESIMKFLRGKVLVLRTIEKKDTRHIGELYVAMDFSTMDTDCESVNCFLVQSGLLQGKDSDDDFISC